MDTADWIAIAGCIGSCVAAVVAWSQRRRAERYVAEGEQLDRLRARHLQAAVNAAYGAAMEFDQTPELALVAVTEWLGPMVEAPQEREA